MVENSDIRILVLDDDPFMLKLLPLMLAHQGFSQVRTCDNGRTALELVAPPGTLPNLILCDLNMPGMDGLEFVRKLVEQRYSGSLILVSGEDERLLQTAERLVKAHRITVLGHLHKPVTPQDLALVLENWNHPRKPPSGGVKRIFPPDEIRAALAQGELVNFYQPKVALATGAVVGLETLVRWRHPLHGLIYPDQFIAVAEADGLIDELTGVVLVGAFTQAKAWVDAGLNLRVAVNVSMANLASLDFADFVARIAAESGVPPQEVVLEVTESKLMGDLRAPLEVLTRLRLKRFHLSIDDFGTGYSSLTQLRDIPFDELKIDQGFVHGAWTDGTKRAIYDASLQLANQLHMEVVAEGVEDQQDWDFIRRSGCHLAQGYFIARPMPGADLPAWIEQWKSRQEASFSPDPGGTGRP